MYYNLIEFVTLHIINLNSQLIAAPNPYLKLVARMKQFKQDQRIYLQDIIIDSKCLILAV